MKNELPGNQTLPPGTLLSDIDDDCEPRDMDQQSTEPEDTHENT